MSGVMYGYAHVSMRAQKEDRQLIALRDFGVASEHIVVEKQSGKNFDRPLYQERKFWSSGQPSPKPLRRPSSCWTCRCWIPAWDEA